MIVGSLGIDATQNRNGPKFAEGVTNKEGNVVRRRSFESLLRGILQEKLRRRRSGRYN